MGACRGMRLPRSESESQSMSPFSGALDSLAAPPRRRRRRPRTGPSGVASTEDRAASPASRLSGVKSYGGGPSSSSSSFGARATLLRRGGPLSSSPRIWKMLLLLADFQSCFASRARAIAGAVARR